MYNLRRAESQTSAEINPVPDNCHMKSNHVDPEQTRKADPVQTSSRSPTPHARGDVIHHQPPGRHTSRRLKPRGSDINASSLYVTLTAGSSRRYHMADRADQADQTDIPYQTNYGLSGAEQPTTKMLGHAIQSGVLTRPDESQPDQTR